MKCVINQALILAAAFSVAAAAPDLCVPNWIGSDDAACLYWHSALGLGTSYKCVQEPVTASQSRTPYACCTTGSTDPAIVGFNNNCVVTGVAGGDSDGAPAGVDDLPPFCIPTGAGNSNANCVRDYAALGLGTSYKCVQEPVTASQSRTPYACCTTGSTAPVINEFNNNCVVNSGSSTVTSILALAATAMLVIAMV